MRNRDIPKAIAVLKREAMRFKVPYVTGLSNIARDPFKVLISCILSLRTKDSVTKGASVRLFKKADTPAEMSGIPLRTIEETIYPAGFYRVKARTIKGLSKGISGKHSSKVPDTMEGLLNLKGVGRKTANLVLTMGYNKPGICVDTHVHRLTNRWGYVKTKTPFDTESALRRKLPERYWITFNTLLVAYGQNVCKPVSPLCSRCRLFRYCDRVGVGRKR
ncbi:MAG: endonuclease III [Deltaproteobacteria bacterium]|nr:endonuclease III [Deltaproteobacteria bacterium]